MCPRSKFIWHESSTGHLHKSTCAAAVAAAVTASAQSKRAYVAYAMVCILYLFFPVLARTAGLTNIYCKKRFAFSLILERFENEEFVAAHFSKTFGPVKISPNILPLFFALYTIFSQLLKTANSMCYQKYKLSVFRFQEKNKYAQFHPDRIHFVLSFLMAAKKGRISIDEKSIFST